MTLTEFLLARIAEDEDIARNTMASMKWSTRVLAECEAKRRIVELHADGGNSQGYDDTGYGEYDHACTECGAFGEYGIEWPCATLRALAYVYAGHPDYRQEWKL